MNYYNHHIGDYAKDTGHLTLIEDGAYRRMLDLYYSSEKPLPLDRAKLHRLLRATARSDRAAIDSVLEEFFRQAPDGWHHKRCDEEIEKAQAKSGKARESANNRWQCERNANAMRTHKKGNAPNSQEPITNSQKHASPSAENGSRRTIAAIRLRAAGVKVTGQNPLLIAWIDAGATDAQLDEAVERARQNKPAPEPIPAAYLDPIVRDVLNPQPRKANGGAWWATEQATTAMGEKVGLHARSGETWDSFRQRIREAIGRQQ